MHPNFNIRTQKVLNWGTYTYYISYLKHIYTRYKFNKYIVLQFGPVKIKVPNKLFTNKSDKNIYI